MVITNTRGMSQFADGGLVATKPYVSSANYINKMGRYCRACHYNCKEKQRTTPAHSTHDHFLVRHKKRFEGNPRMKMMYVMLAKIAAGEKSGY